MIDRIQTGGVTNLNLPTERIEEVGNYESVQTIRDIPDLSFELESLDVSTEIEALLLRLDPTTTNDGDEFDFTLAVPLDIVSPFKAGKGSFAIVGGLALPVLTLENVTYRFGVAANATQTFTLRGDAIYYVPGSPYYQEWAYAGAGTYNFTNVAIPYDEAGNDVYALGVCWHKPSTAEYGRLVHGTDYTNTANGFTVTAAGAAGIPTGTVLLHCVYGSLTADNRPQSVHEDVSVKPAAVRGKDIDIYIGYGATPVMTRWTSVQSFEATRRVTLDADREFGNHHYVAQDYDTPEVNGNLVIRPRNVLELFDKLQVITDVPDNEVMGALSSQPVQLEARIYDPDATTPTVLKTLYVPDARFTPPALQGRVRTKTEPTFPFESDSGTLLVYQGERP